MVEVLRQGRPRHISQRGSSLLPRFEVAGINGAMKFAQGVGGVPLNELGGGSRSAVAGSKIGH